MDVFPPPATKSITGASAIPQLLQNFVVSAICTPHLGQNISIAPVLMRNGKVIAPSRITQAIRHALSLGEKPQLPDPLPEPATAFVPL